MIQINELSKKYDNKIIFENVSCLMENGRIYALVGINGIGKSTLLNAITQPAYLDSGTVMIDGINTVNFQSKYHFFYVPDNKEMFLNMTGYEYLKFISRLYHRDYSSLGTEIQKLAEKFKLEKSLNEYIANYSLGMKQKVYLIAAFLSRACNLILDEPFNGLDPESVAILKQMLSKYRDDGKMVLFSTHNLDLVANYCDKVVFIDKHRKIYECDNPQDFSSLENIFFECCISRL